MYLPDQSTEFKEKMRKLQKKDRPRLERLLKKMDEILENPHHYKQLGNVFKGSQRVHLDPFVLTFEVNEERKIVRFLDFDHHDRIYKN
jgi:YafQ family addiction module toxin component